MRKLDRTLAKKPARWNETAKNAVLDHAKFEQRAKDFQALDINDPARRAGFSAYAPDVLPKGGFKSAWGRHKKEIAKISHGQCSYCECTLNAERVGQVEHFKPKALFPLSAYDWDNYLLACGGCNGPKSDNWPKAGEYVRPDHPAYSPENHFQFHAHGDVDWLNAEAEQTIKDFDLKRQLLVKDRKMFLEVVEFHIKLIAMIGKADETRALQVAGELWSRLNDPQRYPYSTALRQYASVALKQALPGFAF